MKITLLPADTAKDIFKVIQLRTIGHIVSGHPLLHIPEELFGTTLDVSRINGTFITIGGWAIPPWFVDEVHTE